MIINQEYLMEWIILILLKTILNYWIIKIK